ncbi:rCG35267 [Rattus norvegicus]|uniref:RCG35267 n=1 Tax=Rattus norvegicus TaxID=10116 RepID=A6HEB6_RAT|nr:rCG35267 [Rattus norvegicus]
MQWALFHLPMLLAAGLTAFWVFMNIGLVNAAPVKPAERRLGWSGTQHCLPTSGWKPFVLRAWLFLPSAPLQVFNSSQPSLVLPNSGETPMSLLWPFLRGSASLAP